MSTVQPHTLTHLRAMPEAYPRLIELVEATPDNPEKAATEVWNRVGQLETEELDKNRYFAVGSALCHYVRTMSPVLTDPARRQELIETGAKQILVEGSAHPTTTIQTMFERPMERSLAGRPMSERIVGDCLVVQINNRVKHPEALLSDRTYLEAEILRPLRTGGDSYLANDLKSRALGAVTLLDLIVSVAQINRGKGHQNSLPSETDIEMLRSSHTLMWLKRFAARVPIPYFLDVATRNIEFDTDENGVQKLRDINWDAEQIIMDQRKTHDPRFRNVRTAKLVCPAMHVPGMIDDNVALAIDMMDRARQIQMSTSTS